MRHSSKRSDAFLDGFSACNAGHVRSQNPFIKYLNSPDNRDAPADLIELMLKKAQEWTEGWNKRFYGEDLHSEP